MNKQSIIVEKLILCMISCLLLSGCGGGIYKNLRAGRIEPVKKYYNDKKNDLNEPRWHGNTPLSLGVEHGHEEIIEFLISKGADPDAHNADAVKSNLSKFPTCTPIMVAAYYGREELIKLLAAKGADVNSRDKYGNTALMWALYGDACFHTRKTAALLPYLVNSSSAQLNPPMLICPRPGIVNLEDNTEGTGAIRKIADFVYYLNSGSKRFLIQYFYNDSLWLGKSSASDKILGIPTILETNIKPDGIYILNYSISAPGWNVWIDELQLPESLIKQP